MQHTQEHANFQQAFTGDGRANRFRLVAEPASAAHVILIVGGLLQQPGTSYTVDGRDLVFLDGVVLPKGLECTYRVLKSDALVAMGAGK